MSRLSNLPPALAATLLALLICLSMTSSSHAMTPSNLLFPAGIQSALEVAIRADDPGAVDRALKGGASANATGKFNVTPLMVAVDVQSLGAVRALLAAGALPNARAQDRNGPVSLAVKSCRAKPHGWDIMLAVFKAGGDPDTRQPDDDPVLMRFILDHDPAGLGIMKSLGANLDILDRGGNPLITNVAMAQDWDMVWAFIELGAEVDYENGRSRQPLSLALKGNPLAPGTPLYAYRAKVWHFLNEKGVALPPLN